MDLYINSTGIISASGNNKSGEFLQPPARESDRVLAIEPDYAGEIPPMQLRRMSKAVRMGMAAARVAMKQAGIERPDGFSIGTAMGCLHDTEVFLNKMVEQEEQMLTPTAFIQSTHNTVAGQIALLTGCYGHNLTYVQRGHSFEHAMIDAQLYLENHPGDTILAGGIDELTNISFAALQRAKIYRKDFIDPANILTASDEGTIAGEGAAFFVVSDTPLADKYLHVKDIATIITKDNVTAFQKVNDFLSRNEINADDIDLVLLGLSGDVRSEAFYKGLREVTFRNNSHAAYKHLGGEYGTASSFGLGLLMHAVTTGTFPEAMVLNRPPAKLKNILFINNYAHYYSCWYIKGS
jgi:3-oxoacyl-(acyl-carrier-protein) synthase